MSLDQWILALHVLSAFAYAAGIVLFWVLIVTVRRIDTPEGTIRISPAAKVGTASVGIGGVGTLLFGLWLAFSVGDYDIWDGWIIAAIVLWAIAGGLGGRTGKEYKPAWRRPRSSRRPARPGRATSSSRSTARSAGSCCTCRDRRLRPHPRGHDLEAWRVTSLLAAHRPTDWNFPLFLHVFGAMVLVGGLLTGASILAFARGDTASPSRVLRLARGRAARLGADAHRRRVDQLEGGLGRPPGEVDEPSLARHRVVSADVGGMILLVPSLSAESASTGSEGQGAGLLKATLILSFVLLAAYVVTVWAMAGKPS